MARKRKGEGQTALVTGASMGIGVDLAECFAKDGYDLIVTARSEAALKDVAARLAAKYNIRATPIALDLGAIDGAHKLAGAIKAQGLSVDVLVNNAGYGIAGQFDGSNEVDQMGMIDLNVRALVGLTHIFWPSMLANRRGGVLNVASTAAFQPGPLMAVYYASKAFVLSFSEALWREALGTGVQVSVLCPGPTASNFRERAGTGKTRLKNLGTPMGSAPVARMGYRAFQNNQRVMISGLRNRILARLGPFLPRKLLLDTVYNIQSPA
ncbi:MAG TPA: SDR family oxidoreductase [Rhizomicrobium sp.]|nr:SDR family oxidoreductase [Rhizomicrobium sp.]